MSRSGRIQLQVALPYNQDAADHGAVRRYLERGFRLVQLQRVGDHEALVTLEPARPAPEAAGRPR